MGLDSYGSTPFGQRRSQATLWPDSLRLLQVPCTSILRKQNKKSLRFSRKLLLVQQMKSNPNPKRLLPRLVFRWILRAGHRKNSRYACQLHIMGRIQQTGIEISCIPRDLIIVIFYYQISLKPLKTLSLVQVSFPLLFPLCYIVPPVFTNSDKGKYKGKKTENSL